MADVGAFIANMEKAGAKVDALAGKVEKSAKDNSKAWGDVSTGLLGVGAAATVGLGAVASGYANFDAAMSQVSASTGASVEDMERLRKAAMDAGAEFGQFSSTDAAGALEELGKAGLDTTQSIAALSGVMGLAAADGMQVARAAEITAQGLAQFGLGAERATDVANLLAQGAGAAVGSAEELGQGLSNVGSVASSFGMSIEETTTALAVFAQNGKRGAEGGTLMKSMLLSLANPSKEAARAIDELGLVTYDANGKFVGMRNLFGQLQAKTKGWTDEQKNATFATIFGTHAVTAASIAAKEGAAGYDAMTDSMHGFGSAAEMARKRTDNLKGDLAELGGAWENLTIKMGSNADGPLRWMTQQATDAVEALGEMPPALQGAALGTGALVGGSALLVGGLMKATTAAADARQAYRTLAGDFPKTASAMRSMAIYAGAAAAGLTTLTIAGAAYQHSIDKSLMSTQAMQTELLALGRGQTNLGKINADIVKLGSSATSLGEAMRYMDGQSGALDRFGLKMGKAIPNVLGMKSAATKYREELQKVDLALASLDEGSAAATFNQLVKQSGVDAEQAAGHFTKYRAKLEQSALELQKMVPSFDASKLSAKDYAKWMGGEVPQAVKKAAAAAVGAGRDISGLGVEMSKGAKSAEELRAAMLGIVSAQLQLFGGRIGLKAAIDDFTKGLKENGKSLDINTEKGRANLSALASIANQYLQNIANLEKADASTATLTAAQREMRVGMEELIAKTGASGKTLQQLRQDLGLTALETKMLEEAYAALPGVKETKVSALGARSSKAEVDEFIKSLAGVDPETKAYIRTIAELTDVETAKAALASIKDKTVYIRTIYSSNWVSDNQAAERARGGPGLPRKAATGGPIWGPGTGTSDDIPMWLSNGEFVLREWAASKIGYDVLSWINRHGTLPPARADGGRVMPPAWGRPMPSTPAHAPGFGGNRITSTFSPTIYANGLDPHTVVSDAMFQMRQEMRSAAIPGGSL